MEELLKADPEQGALIMRLFGSQRSQPHGKTGRCGAVAGLLACNFGECTERQSSAQGSIQLRLTCRNGPVCGSWCMLTHQHIVFIPIQGSPFQPFWLSAFNPGNLLA